MYSLDIRFGAPAFRYDGLVGQQDDTIPVMIQTLNGFRCVGDKTKVIWRRYSVDFLVQGPVPVQENGGLRRRERSSLGHSGSIFADLGATFRTTASAMYLAVVVLPSVPTLK
jgi:hypothetical protein